MAYTAFCSNENRLFFCVILICWTLFWLSDEAFCYKGFICSSVIRAGAPTECTMVRLNLRFQITRTARYCSTRRRVSLYQFNAGMFCLFVCLFLSQQPPVEFQVTTKKMQLFFIYLFIYFYRLSTCFRRFLRPSSGAHNLHTASVWSTNTAMVDEMEL